MKWLQRYKHREIILEGDSNTTCSHAKDNGRRRGNWIVSFEQEEGVIEGEAHLLSYINKKMFGHVE